MKLDPKRRKAAEEFIYLVLAKVDPSGENLKLAKSVIPGLSDEDFNQFRKGIPVYNPTGGKVKIDHERNIAIAKALGVNLCQRLWLTDTKTGVRYLTVNEHKVLPLPVRVQTQFQDKKMSVADHDRVRDKLTNQVTGPSKTSAFTFSEAQLAFSDGLDATISEFIHSRGGNEKLNQAFYRSLRETGKGRIDIPGAEFTSAKAPKTLGAYFKAMHIGNNLGKPGVKTA